MGRVRAIVIATLLCCVWFTTPATLRAVDLRDVLTEAGNRL